MKIAEKCENFSSARPQTPDFSRSVCLFDSGIGGLNVLFACRRILPDEKFVYYGDNERAPYGNLPEEAVKAFRILGAKQFIGMHWGTFKLSDEPLDEPMHVLPLIWEKEELERQRLESGVLGKTLRLDKLV